MFPWLAGIPPARAFVGDGGYGQLPNHGHLRRVKRHREGLGRSKGRLLLAGITQTQERHVWIAGESVVHALRYRQVRQERLTGRLFSSTARTIRPLLQRLVIARCITQQLARSKCLETHGTNTVLAGQWKNLFYIALIHIRSHRKHHHIHQPDGMAAASTSGLWLEIPLNRVLPARMAWSSCSMPPPGAVTRAQASSVDRLWKTNTSV